MNYDKEKHYNKDNVSISIFIDTEANYGYFEYEVEQTDEEIQMFGEQESIYVEGGLWFDGNQLVDYDGIDTLPEEVIKLIQELGYKTDAI